MHRADTYIRKISGECELLSVPLDAAERRNLGRYIKNLIEKQGARCGGRAAVLRPLRYPTVREPQDKALAGLGRRSGGLKR